MKKFRFTLEAVQTMRQRTVNEAMEHYARALRARLAAETAVADAEQALSEHIDHWRKAMKKSFSPGDMLRQEHARLMLETRRNERANELREAAKLASEALSAFHLARQKSEVVERFHDRQRRDFNLAVLKEEQNMLDELASARRDPGLFERGVAHA